jgi:AcrR family transcriptional regulator
MTGTRARGTPVPRPPEVPRLSRDTRRDALLDAAQELVRAGGVESVSMESVAGAAGVSRPLVYKHFANSGDLLAAIYRREAVALYQELASQVAAAGSLEEMYRTLIRGALRAAAERGPVFLALRSAGAWNLELRQEQRSRDRDTVRAFAARAVRERHLDPGEATVVTAIVLGAIVPVLAQWRRRPTPGNASLLEETYLRMMRAAYQAVPPAAPP